MKTSRVAVFHGKDRPFTIESVPVPALRHGEILIRNEYTTLCRSDLNTYTGKRTEKTPTILGHEVVGRIEELGPSAPAADLRGAALRVGDRVTWGIYASDPGSDLARAGMPQKAPGLFKYGHELVAPGSHLHGGLAEYCILRANTPIVRVDSPVPLSVLALVNCAVATVAGALRLAGGVRDREVLVAGAGMLGVAACAMCRTAGARRVIAVDVDRNRLEIAKDFGADRILCLPVDGGSPMERLASADPAFAAAGMEPMSVAFDFSGVPDTMEAVLGCLGIGGTCVLVGATYPARPLRVDAERVVRRIQSLRGLHNYNADDLAAAVEFVERHHDAFPFARLVRGGFVLSEVAEAFACGLNSGAHRVGIQLGSGGARE